jgi:small-conductance mechanosensitive channel
VYLSIDVEDREAEQLKVQLLQANEEIDYLKRHQNIEMREALEQALRHNRLLEATIGDLRDELQYAKDALKSQGSF